MRIVRGVPLLLLALVLTACGGSGEPAPVKAEPTPAHHAAPTATPKARTPLRAGERRVKIAMPASYKPSAPHGVGTDDYRCFLLDPKVAQDSFVTGFDVLPGNPDVVHHVILFRVPPSALAEAERTDAETPGQGWTCFGNSGLDESGGLDDAPWLGAWAPGGTEQLYGAGLGESFPKGSRIVMQVHYNLLAGTEPDSSAAELRLTSDPSTTPLETQLLPAPVELPCRPGHPGKLCDREAAFADVQARFGRAAQTANLLHLLCGGEPAGPVQTCTRTIDRPETVRAAAGHMHLLGRSIKVEANPGTPRARTLLDIKVWDFDNQRSRPIPAVRLRKGDTVKVTCRHDQSLRDLLPSFKGQPERYVMWGEGTTDEMCLGILLVTRP
ncbi:MAG: hypothetical protein J7518_17785 [Nocardioidaceae bacterium]|nr:hypothetical protein [Nocardioidaceae bacterium]